MKDLHYATVTTPQHSVVVSTWTEAGEVCHRMTVDGNTLSYGPLDNPWTTEVPDLPCSSWDSCPAHPRAHP